MDKSRSIDTKFWDDTYIVNLDPIEKLLFLYFLTNPLTNLIGIYEISLRRIAFDTGIDRDMVLKILERFSADRKIHYEKGFVLIPNFEKHQRLNPNMKISANKLRDNLPLEIQTISKGLQRVSKGKNITKKVSKQIEYERERESEKESKIEKPLSPNGDFVDNIISVFQKSYKESFEIDYLITNRGKERSAAGKLLSLYKEKNTSASSEKCQSDFYNLFNAICKADYSKSSFLSQISLPKISSQLSIYMKHIKIDNSPKLGSIL